MVRKSMIFVVSLMLFVMSVTVLAQDTAPKPLPMFLLTIQGTLSADTLADASATHNKTAGDANNIAAARSLGDLSHMVYLPTEKPTSGAGDVLFIDQWNSIDGLNKFFANEDVQKGAGLIFSKRDPVVWTPAEGFYTYHLPAPYGKNDRFVVMVRGTVASREAAMELNNQLGGGGINGARMAGDLTHDVYFRLTAPGEAGSLEFLAIDVWMDSTGMSAYYQNPDFQAGISKLFTAPPTVSIWTQTAGEWVEW
jgi:quinol monooxygenase YgiN